MRNDEGRPWRVLFLAGLACWVVEFCWHWSRPPMVTGFAALETQFMTGLYWAGLIAVIIAVIGGRRWGVGLTLVPVLVVATVVVNSAATITPRMWFAVHEPLLEQALDGGSDLPWTRQFLTADGKVSVQPGGGRFFVQRLGLPDDVGGFLHSPGEAPVTSEGPGGLLCIQPVELGGDWWMCGLGGFGL